MKLANICLLVLAAIVAESIQDGIGNKREFLLTYEGFFPIVDLEYRLAMTNNNETSDKISLSMYRYFMVQHLYARLAGIHSGPAPDTDPSTSKLRSLLYATTIYAPASIINYLNALGAIQPEGTYGYANALKLSSVIWPNDEGHFGKIDASNHWKYMSFPAPSIVAQAIQEDYSQTIRPMTCRQPFWNVRSSLVPDDNGDATSERCKSPGLPTQNLLGWKPRNLLTQAQLAILEGCNITYRTFDTTERKFYVNPCLISQIQTILRQQLRRSYLIEQDVQGFFPHLGSSRTILRPLIPTQLQSGVTFNRTAVYTDNEAKLSGSDVPSDLDDALAVALMVYKDKNLLTWSIFDWNEYQCIPKAWIDSANYLLDFNGIKSTVTGVESDSKREQLRINLRRFVF